VSWRKHLKLLEGAGLAEKVSPTQSISTRDHAIIVQAGRDAILQLRTSPPNIRLVKITLTEDMRVGMRQRANLILKNNGDKTAVLLRGDVLVTGSQHIESCNNLTAKYKLVKSDWQYDVDMESKNPHFEGKHAVEPNEVVSFEVCFGRFEGGPDVTIYRCSLKLNFDEGNPLETDNFFVRISGPTEIAGMCIHSGPTEDEWGRCWADNIRRLDSIGYDARNLISAESAKYIEKVAPGLLSR
jgi:hypothetical protein